LRENREGLEYFVRCELHLSDVSTLVSSIKRNAEDVKTTKEVKYKRKYKHTFRIADKSVYICVCRGQPIPRVEYTEEEIGT
ncbi:hypothetical protein XENOCAPTIV_022048, partial [Xenoophorus captivus]